MPAKSSKSGAVLAVVPGVLGLVCWSPELDSFGNSWKAVHFCEVEKPSQFPRPLLSIVGFAYFLLVYIVLYLWTFWVSSQELVSTFQLHSFDIRTPFRQVLTYRQWKAESEVSMLPFVEPMVP